MPPHSRSAPLPRPSPGRRFPHRDRVDAVLTRRIADPSDRAFVVRCITEEGPRHHRESTAAMLLLLDALLQRLPAREGASAGPAVPVPMRLPPHVADELDPRDGHYPLAMPTEALRSLGLAQGEVDALVECLLDGPPHHALANAVMVEMLTEALRRVPR